MHWSWQEYDSLPLSVLSVLRDELREEQIEAERIEQQQ